MANIEPLNHDTFNHMTYYAHVWEENQWEWVPIFEKKTNEKKKKNMSISNMLYLYVISASVF